MKFLYFTVILILIIAIRLISTVSADPSAEICPWPDCGKKSEKGKRHCTFHASQLETHKK